MLLPRQSESFKAELRAYLSDTLHVKVDVSRWQKARSLPAYLSHLYQIYEVMIAGRRLVVLANDGHELLVSDIGKHVHVVRVQTGCDVAYAAATLSSRYRGRLIKEGIGFIIPGNQIYLPELAMDLREQFRPPLPAEGEALSPAAQALLFYHLLHQSDNGWIPSRIAEMLGYSAMTMTRAFDDLSAHKLAVTEREGTRRHIRFLSHGRELFARAAKLLRSPVRQTRYVKDVTDRVDLPLAGESALSARSNLAPPLLPTYAIYVGAWKGFLRGARKAADDRDDAAYSVDVWSYDPRSLSHGNTVDPLSLYVQYKDSVDERVAAAAENIFAEVQW